MIRMIFRLFGAALLLAACAPSRWSGTAAFAPLPPQASRASASLVSSTEITDFPCAGCLFNIPATYNPAVKAPLLVLLHGDEGTPSVITSFMKDHAMSHGYLLLSLNCPRDQGCSDGRWGTGSWHPQGMEGSIAWILSQISAARSAYNVDASRIHALGGSGGAVYLGYHADKLAPTVAGFALTAGGWSSLWQSEFQCPNGCAFPLYILTGSADFLLNLAQMARDYYGQCGHEVVYKELPGATHQDVGYSLTGSEGETIMSWFDARSNRCVAGPAPSPSPSSSPSVTPPPPAPSPGPSPSASPLPPPSPSPSPSASPSPSPSPQSIVLSATARKTKRSAYVDLAWSGASATVDLFRNGARIASVSGSSYTDSLGSLTGSFAYRVCDSGSVLRCSADQTVVFSARSKSR